MPEIMRSATFNEWLRDLRDKAGRAKITGRIVRLQAGNAGDVSPIGDGLSEMRIDFGPGYRVYFMRRGALLIVLLAGGDKSTQTADIANAKAIAKQWE